LMVPPVLNDSWKWCDVPSVTVESAGTLILPESVADRTAVILWFWPSLKVRVANAGRFNWEPGLATSNSVGFEIRL